MNGAIIPVSNRPSKIYRNSISVSVINAWGSLYIGSTSVSITDAGDLSQKDVFVSVHGGGSTCLVSVDNITTNTINLTLARGTTGTISGVIVVYVFDR